MTTVSDIAPSTNTRFSLAVHALTLLMDAAPARLSSEVMSGSTRANSVHMRRVLGHLRRAGMVASRSGPNGGWTMTADPAATTLADLWTIVNTDELTMGMHDANPECRVGRAVQAALHDIERRAAKAALDELASVSLSDLVAQPAVASGEPAASK